jgi:hypothetical protein
LTATDTASPKPAAKAGPKSRQSKAAKDKAPADKNKKKKSEAEKPARSKKESTTSKRKKSASLTSEQSTVVAEAAAQNTADSPEFNSDDEQLEADMLEALMADEDSEDQELEAAILQGLMEDEDASPDIPQSHPDAEGEQPSGSAGGYPAFDSDEELEAAILEGLMEDEDANDDERVALGGTSPKESQELPTNAPIEEDIEDEEEVLTPEELARREEEERIRFEAEEAAKYVAWKPKGRPEWAPSSHDFLDETDPQFGKYCARVVFECAPCPEEQRYGAYQAEQYDWNEEKKGEKRKKVDGTLNKSKHKQDGLHIVESAKHRLSASEKLIRWRETTLYAESSKYAPESISKGTAKKPRLVTLIEGEPYGPFGEPMVWAEKIKALSQFITRQAPGSHITIVLDCTINPGLAAGHYVKWYEAILALKQKHPDNVTVEIRNDTVMTGDSSSAHPRKLTEEEEVAKAWDDAEKSTHKRLEPLKDGEYLRDRMEGFLETNKMAYETQCATIDGNIEFCRDFIRTIRDMQTPTGTASAPIDLSSSDTTSSSSSSSSGSSSTGGKRKGRDEDDDAPESSEPRTKKPRKTPKGKGKGKAKATSEATELQIGTHAETTGGGLFVSPSPSPTGNKRKSSDEEDNDADTGEPIAKKARKTLKPKGKGKAKANSWELEVLE